MGIQVEVIIRDDSGREITINKAYSGCLRRANLEEVESLAYQVKIDVGQAFELDLLSLNQSAVDLEKKKRLRLKRS